MDPGDILFLIFKELLIMLCQGMKSQDFFAKAIMTNDREYTYYRVCCILYLGEIDRAYINAKKAYELNQKH